MLTLQFTVLYGVSYIYVCFSTKFVNNFKDRDYGLVYKALSMGHSVNY